MKFITEVLEDIKYITEDNEAKGKNYFIEGTFLQTDGNRNKRIYPRELLAKEVDRYNQEYIAKNRAFGELGHPDDPTIHLDRVSHMITALKPDGDHFYGKAKIMDTPYGNIVKGIIDGGGQLGVSSRGMGSLKPGKDGYQVVQDDYRLATAADIVADPSAHRAYVNAVFENKEWLLVDGVYVEEDIDTAKTQLKKASRRELESVALKLFENFLRKL